MTIRVTVDEKIGNLQASFHAAFPYLKLVFFSRAHNAFEGSAAQYRLDDPEILLGALQADPRSGALEIDPEMPTWQVEQRFEKEFGLHVQVFRKSGHLWLETSRTDELTLRQQNSKGQESEHMPAPEIEQPDYREQE